METRFAGLSIEEDAVCCSALAALARLQTGKSSDAHIAGENDLKSFCACGRKLCETF